MPNRNWLALLSVALTASSCPPGNAPTPATPTLINIGGYGKWIKATATQPDRFGFSTRAADDVCPSVQQVSFSTCPARYPDTAFIDFSIPARTTFEVSSNGMALTEVAQGATMGDLQYRRAALDDGSGPAPKWRVAVAVPGAGRKWCPPTHFPVDIVDVSSGQRSAPLRVDLAWGYCQSDTGIILFATGNTGTPAATSPPAPTPDCPGGTFSKAFNVCETCAAGGIPFPATFWGCSLPDAQAKMQGFGCTSVLRTGVNC
jgi:hypothetical protein